MVSVSSNLTVDSTGAFGFSNTYKTKDISYIGYFTSGIQEPVHCMGFYKGELVSATTANRIGVHTSLDRQVFPNHLIVIFTARKRSLGQGNIFTSVCQEFCSREGVPGPGGCLETPPGTATAAGGTHPTGTHSCLNMKAVTLLYLN